MNQFNLTDIIKKEVFSFFTENTSFKIAQIIF